jgi:hypothetical protein
MRRRMMRRNPVASSIMEGFQNAFMDGRVTVSVADMPARFDALFPDEKKSTRVINRLEANKVEPSDALVDRLAVVGLALNQDDSDAAITTMVRIAKTIKNEEEAKAFMTQVDSILAGQGVSDPDLPPKAKPKSKVKPKRSTSQTKATPKPKREVASAKVKPKSQPEEDFGFEEFQQDASVTQGVDRTIGRSGVASKARLSGKYELSNSELVRLAIYRRSDARQRQTYGRFFLFLQFGQRTKPIPGVDVWLKAVEEGRSGMSATIQSEPALMRIFDDISYQNPDFRRNIFMLYRPFRKGMPTQMYVPSSNPIRSNDGKNRLIFSPAAEFVSRTDIKPGSPLPADLKKAYLGYTDEERSPTNNISIGQAGQSDSVMSYYQLADAIGVQQGVGPDGRGNWRRRREKYSAYGVFFFQEGKNGDIELLRYFPAPRPALIGDAPSAQSISDQQLNQLPNPRRNRRRTRRTVHRRVRR